MQIENGIEVVYLATDKLFPDPNQDRDDTHSAHYQEHVKAIAESIKIEVQNPDGSVRRYGVRRPIEVEAENEEGLYKIIAGETRWRGATLAEEETVPCIIRTGHTLERRLDHVTDNALRKDLSLWQQARSIQRDQEEFGLSTDQVMVAHGINSKSRLSKIAAVFKLPEEAQELVKSGIINNVDAVYEVKGLKPDALQKLIKRVSKNENFSVALAKVKPKAKKEPNPDIKKKYSVSFTEEALALICMELDIDIEGQEPESAKAKLQAYVNDLSSSKGSGDDAQGGSSEQE
ncbi:hypothetical protein WH50_06365 [Pokkaliibacter plantistimulans]|uniref:ParB-like N-terminal domain-containing protein n=1 Tax=Pokkaliibacter plantistimulans TaxID=1635171 RepID=A0ABX5M2X4_9GAMM|nr:ParB/RepB/Spo0J family partition protein [Pokkaliibacter plantistimulans]PXF32078.1 hypothetical protein WH50_06365 [Pokkaliibacter plantistimulans]